MALPPAPGSPACWLASRRCWCGWLWPTRWPASSGPCWPRVGLTKLRPRAPKGARLWGCWGVGRSKERDGATVTETGSGQPALRQALQARGTDWDLIRELPSGPAACEPHQRPHTCQHPTARCTNPEDYSCAKAGVHICRKLWRRPQDGPGPTPVSRFVNLWKTEAEREQPVLLAHRPRARKAKALAQPQHGFKPLDGAPGRVEGLKATNPRHGPLDPEVVTLNPLLQVLGDVMHRGARQEPVFPGCRDGGWVGPRTIGADPVRGEQGLLLQGLAEEALGGLQVALRREQEVNGRTVLVDGPVQVPPLAANLDVYLVDADRAAVRLAKGAQ